MLILMIFAGICLLAAVGIMAYAFTYDKPKKPRPLPPEPEPLPGGGGTYVLHTSGLDATTAARVVTALIALPGIAAKADTSTGDITVRYQGIPALSLLDDLRAAAEGAGVTVTEIE
ncbi:MAG: hypothetical protein IKI21_07450 [Oscillospiraceae bacterium]|nr:hypothetical protein [Oscillospiraceae bacterium]